MTYASTRYQVNGIAMNVAVAGEGPPVLLVHGFPDTHAVWRHQIPALVAAGYRVIAPDTRGCGESAMPPSVADYGIDKLVADLAALLDVLGIAKVRLVAHDWGAVIAWHFVIRHPQRVDRYVALSVGHPSAYARGGLVQKLKGYYILVLQLRRIAEFLLTRGNWFLFGLMTRYPEELPAWRSCLSRPGRLTAGINYYRANLRMILPGDWPPVEVPVFGIWSTGDSFLAEGQMLESERYVEAPWRYARIEGANHWLQLTAPGKLNPLLLDYLR